MDQRALGQTVQNFVESDQGIKRSVVEWSPGNLARNIDRVAEEVAVALVYNGVSHVVMMATPANIEAFALGFSLTEGIVDDAEDIYGISITQLDQGVEVAITISSRCFMQLKNQRRNLSGRTGCGICGAESLAQIHTGTAKVEGKFVLTHRVIEQATTMLGKHQPLQQLTGAVHGAAWCDVEGNILHLCEDVGRHNALDKLVGSLWCEGAFKRPGFLLVSSRASYEIVQKAAKAGIAIVVAVSAPTSLAICVAEDTDITLVGFSRENRHVVYTHTHRLAE